MKKIFLNEANQINRQNKLYDIDIAEYDGKIYLLTYDDCGNELPFELTKEICDNFIELFTKIGGMIK